MNIGTPLTWAAFVTFVLTALSIDFLAMRRQGAHKVLLREAAVWSAIWIAVSFAFVGLLWWHLGGTGGGEERRSLASNKALEFITGYLIEKTLAVDNIFVFLMLFTYFSVPEEFQKRILMIGILGALALRAGMIFAGVSLISRFGWTLYIFGGFLVFTGFKMWLAAGKQPDLEANPMLRWIRRHMRVAPEFDGDRLFTVVDGERHATPVFVVIVLIGVIDIVFAADSIPAIFAISTDPFIVLTSNVFAILGLRAMYFLLAGLRDKFHLLTYGLAIVLILIGGKMLLKDMYHVPASWSLIATVAVLAATMVLSLFIPVRGYAGSAYPFRAKHRSGPERARDN